MAGANRLDPPHRRQHLVGGILVDVNLAGLRSLRERAAGIGGGVEKRHSLGEREVHYRLGVAVRQHEAIVAQHRVEIPGPQDRHHHVDVSRRQSDRIGQPLFLHLEKLAQRAVGTGDRIQRRRVFGIVEMKQLNVVDRQRLHRLLQRPPNHRGVEAVGVELAVDFGRDDGAVGKPAEFANDLADTIFAAPKPVVARSIDKRRRPGENRPHRLQRAFLADAVAVAVGEVAERARAEADAGHLQVRTPQLGPLDFSGLAHVVASAFSWYTSKNRSSVPRCTW